MVHTTRGTPLVSVADGIGDHPLLDALVSMLDAVESYDYDRFRDCVDDIYGTVDFDPFTGATTVMGDMREWESFYRDAIGSASAAGLSVRVHVERFNAEVSTDGTLGWCDVQITQHMNKPDGTVLHTWRAVVTAIFRYHTDTRRWIEHRWHASLMPA
jgi:hypothetical protein